jgi:hypothetical protein
MTAVPYSRQFEIPRRAWHCRRRLVESLRFLASHDHIVDARAYNPKIQSARGSGCTCSGAVLALTQTVPVLEKSVVLICLSWQ